MGGLGDLLRRWRGGDGPGPGAPAEEEPRVGFTETVTFGRGESIVFFDRDRGIRRTIVDRHGKICGFPGIRDRAAIERRIGNGSLDPVVRFRTSVERRDGRYMLLWQVQPDGRYWGDDDGFGMEDDVEICLYAFLDGRGRFDGPFRLYSVGKRSFYEPPAADGEA